MWLFLIPLGLVAVGVMAVVGTALAVFAAAHAVPWLLILAGVWLVVAANQGRGRRWRTAAAGPGCAPSWGYRPAQPFRPTPSAPPRAPPRPAAARPAAPSPTAPGPTAASGGPTGQAAAPAGSGRKPGARRTLPVDLQIKSEQIRHKADLLLGYANRFPPFSHDLHIVRQTAADYLPRTIEAYLALPGEDDPLVAATGKTALDELRAQLDLLDARLDEIARDLQRQDIDRLAANRRFLEERFRGPDAGEPGAGVA